MNLDSKIPKETRSANILRVLRACSFTAILLTLQGCGMVGSMYYPQLAEVPLIAGKGDTRASASINGIGADATISTGLSNHLSMQLSSSIHQNENIFYHHAALGYYTSFEHFGAEGYLGFGFGSGNVNNPGEGYATHGTYILPFVQVNLGWRNLTKAHIDCGVAFKYGRMSPNFRISYETWHGDTQTTTYSSGTYSSINNLFEPQVFFHIGGEKVKYSLQIGMSILDDMLYYKDNNAYVVPYNPLTMSMGVTFFLTTNDND